jgi:hypothetical protein
MVCVLGLVLGIAAPAAAQAPPANLTKGLY